MTINNRVSKYNSLAILNNHIVDYPTPINLNYMWNFGSLAGISLIIQIITGIFLAMHYTPHIDYAFVSIEHIMRDVNNNWLIHYLHANVVSMFFIKKQNKVNIFTLFLNFLKYKL